MKTDLHRNLTVVTLVTGATSTNREAAIAAAILATTRASAAVEGDPKPPHAQATALILEGMPDGRRTLDAIIDLPGITMTRITPGCICCTGNLVMTVSLNRLLRQRPDRLFISLASSEHLDNIRQFLTNAPYDAHLILGGDLHVT